MCYTDTMQIPKTWFDNFTTAKTEYKTAPRSAMVCLLRVLCKTIPRFDENHVLYFAVTVPFIQYGTAVVCIAPWPCGFRPEITSILTQFHCDSTFHSCQNQHHNFLEVRRFIVYIEGELILLYLDI